jgi:predicted TIM-barrel fold metal-dependent hydrolase
MIDAHIHVVPPNLPGVGPLHPLLRSPEEEVARALLQQMKAVGITHALAMGHRPVRDDDPLGIASTLQLARLVPGLRAIGIADPSRTDAGHLRRVESELASRRVVALKAYLGYLHFSPDHPNYRPYYELAARFRLPMIFHTGDTYSPYAKLKHAHPLLVDEVAVDHPDVKFVIAHVGNPWLIDAAEVVYKNMNVWTDLSGLIVGDDDAFLAEERQQAVSEVIENVGRAFRYAERPNRFVYGTDWPLAPMPAYRALIEAVIPPEHHEQVFVENARRLFALDE